ncbi:adenine glycosylase [Kiloniella spongiae]|uniref:Adenine DNA glycosylase n=1 Tax=Kiloniella spongiae TaxID=1489064 RepID=A0A0H2N048_9PROT|nr:A/G-specific adenine glycosylase [Kiloniella spongiae]KLN62290.1 adenine glycosylase [Kiloniella spongiae]
MIAEELLPWYDRHARELPWRLSPRQKRANPEILFADPYRVWLSEIMLQQTTVATVKGYYEKFLTSWPTVQDLAKEELDSVLSAWAGLGYYARARNLHKCAKVIAEELGGVFPDTEEALLKLPGVGPYTAAAIAAIAFGRSAVVVDGNVERVIARYYALEDPLPGVKSEMKKFAQKETPIDRAGDYAQAMMDLGATICTPRSPGCVICPIQVVCLARKSGIAEALPKKAPKKEKPTRRAYAYLLLSEKRGALLRRRPEKGLLGGMTEVPTGNWIEQGDAERNPEFEQLAQWAKLDGIVKHTFTHFHFEITVLTTKLSQDLDVVAEAVQGKWAHKSEFAGLALPTVMKKILRHADYM